MCYPVITCPLNTNSPESVHEHNCLALDILFKMYLMFFKLLCGTLFKILFDDLIFYICVIRRWDRCVNRRGKSCTSRCIGKTTSCLGGVRVKVPLSKSPCFTIVKISARRWNTVLLSHVDLNQISVIFLIASSNLFSTTC